MKNHIVYGIKGGLSARINFQLFSPLKRKLSNFCFCSIFIFNKQEPQSCQFSTYSQNTQFEFLTPQTGQMAFPIFKVVIRQLCISLTHQPKAVRYFQNTLKPLREIILFIIRIINRKRHNLVQVVFKSSCFLRKKILQI